jgi:very-short-patch-repair endonuclease
MNKVIPYEKSFAIHEKAKFWSAKNGDVKPKDVSICNGEKYWFDCDKCSHDFDAIIASITKGGWCPYCHHLKRCDANDCMFCFNNSFASHEKEKYWSSKNGNIKPKNVFKSTHKKYWFDCDKCSHSFETALCKINMGRWCPYCVNKKMCFNDDCDDCFNKSFASQPKSKYLSEKNGDVNPRNIFKSVANKYWFDCDKCSHDFETSLNDVSGIRGHWCPYCSGHRICDNDECKDCFNNSFASHPKSKYWSVKNGDVIPRNVFKCSRNKYWFDCNKCNNSHESSISNTIKTTGLLGCPHCVHQGEFKLYTPLKSIYPSIIHQFKQEWCKNKRCLPFDFCIPELNIIIELDGSQHFQQTSNWSPPEEQHEIDIYKEQCANENGYSMIRLLEYDVTNDTYDWLQHVQRQIEYIKKNDTIIHNIYICENDEYDLFLTYTAIDKDSVRFHD